jgi:putative aminopeptidase FrvX
LLFQSPHEDGFADLAEQALSHVQALLAIPSPTGFTERAVDYCYQILGRSGCRLKRTHGGGLVAMLPGERDRGLVLAAHVGTAGAMVERILPDGRLRLSQIGFAPHSSFSGEYGRVHTGEGTSYTGTILGSEGRERAPRTYGRRTGGMEFRLDEWVERAEETSALGIRTGDIVSIDPRAVLLQNGYLKSRHLRDKAGAGILLSLFSLLAERRIPLARPVCLYIDADGKSKGGRSFAQAGEFVEYIVVDAGFGDEGSAPAERAVSIWAKDADGPYSLDLRRKLVALAVRHRVPHAVAVSSRGLLADAGWRTDLDAAAGRIGPVVDVSHAQERTHREAVEATLRLLLLYVQSD